jgi:hypothetical protein
MKQIVLLCCALFFATVAIAKDGDSPALKDAVILIVRHAEKPDSGSGLTTAGEERARAYVSYFEKFAFNATPAAPDYLFAAADSKASRRSRLTLEPLSKATGLAIDDRFKDKQFQELAQDLRSKPHGKRILICWHHGEIPQLVAALGADPGKLFPKGKWPPEVFGWVIKLRYGPDGHLVEAVRINEHLMPDDTDKAAE